MNYIKLFEDINNNYFYDEFFKRVKTIESLNNDNNLVDSDFSKELNKLPLKFKLQKDVYRGCRFLFYR